VTSFELDTANMGTGDIWSTAADLARWDRALASGEILTAASRDAMFAVHASDTGGDDGDLVLTEG
jgi:CubicO group peptidase (beta-lactamase class C family)